ncbi:MAG: PIN domain-containing protein [Nanoarchaeota archaeon]
MVKNIILDTNFILDCIKFKIDIKSEISRILDENFILSIFTVTKRELHNKKNENLALQLLEKMNVNIIDTSSHNVDSAILSLDNNNTIVATADKKLKEKLKNRNIPILVIREKKHLKLV